MDEQFIGKQEKSERNRMLIVSYSYSGHTKQAAEKLQKVTGGDWCEIYPWQPYPMAFPKLLEQVKHEIQVGCHPRLLPGSRSPRPYPVIFVGCPNWCGTLAPPMASWLSKNDLSRKVILPFYSHSGGVPCDFRRDIRKLCPRSDVREALDILEDVGERLPEMLRAWLAQNGL